MLVALTGVSKGRDGLALPETTVEFASGRARLAISETEQRPTILGLIAAGRMRPDTGNVTIDGAKDASALRRRVALVDAPDVSEPASNVTVAGIVAEELMFAGRASHPVAALRWLDEAGARDLARVPIADVAPTQRLRLLLELAILREGVEGVVLVSPDRHGGDPREWWALAEQLAARGCAVLVIAGEASVTVLRSPARHTGARLRSSRVRPRPTRALSAHGTPGGRS